MLAIIVFKIKVTTKVVGLFDWRGGSLMDLHEHGAWDKLLTLVSQMCDLSQSCFSSLQWGWWTE